MFMLVVVALLVLDLERRVPRLELAVPVHDDVRQALELGLGQRLRERVRDLQLRRHVLELDLAVLDLLAQSLESVNMLASEAL